MKRIRMLICLLMVALVPGLSVIGNDLPADKVERVRTGTTLLGAVLGLGGGIATGLGLVPAGTPLSESLLVAIPVAAMATVTGALASRWIAEMALVRQPSLLASPFLGAGLGLVGCAVAGGISFALAAAIAIPTVAAPEGYWGVFNYPQAVGMGFLAGALWMGLAGIPIGGVIVPIISLYMGF
ncbi:hypothetical protein KAU37_07615 [Candidatus Bipolaricaulota bacterium]|nr:hypothetical protein [Candidatus Bipolaricaulota bacterium]